MPKPLTGSWSSAPYSMQLEGEWLTFDTHGTPMDQEWSILVAQFVDPERGRVAREFVEGGFGLEVLRTLLKQLGGPPPERFPAKPTPSPSPEPAPRPAPAAEVRAREPEAPRVPLPLGQSDLSAVALVRLVVQVGRALDATVPEVESGATVAWGPTHRGEYSDPVYRYAQVGLVSP